MDRVHEGNRRTDPRSFVMFQVEASVLLRERSIERVRRLQESGCREVSLAVEGFAMLRTLKQPFT